MLFAASSGSVSGVAYLIGWLIGGFLAGMLFGLLPYFLARWRRRQSLASLAMISCGIAGMVLGPLALPVAVVFTVITLVLPSVDSTFERDRRQVLREALDRDRLDRAPPPSRRDEPAPKRPSDPTPYIRL